ncbi:MAG: ABC transporter substrate-binding protein [Atribacterota bacterium]|nr:ABC transporter substrate-binding protein [Atribacterota bacterium]
MKNFLRNCSIVGLVLLFALLNTFGVFAQSNWQPAPEFIDIGATLELTGPTALQGDQELKKWELAVEKINDNGGIDGIPVRMVYEDNQGTNPGSISAYNILAYDREVYAAFITTRSTIAHALNPLVAEAKIPTLYGGSAWSVRELGNPWMFGVRTNDRNVAKIMAQFIAEDLGHTKVAALYSDEAFGQGGNEETVAALAEYDIKPLTVQRFQRNTLDYTAQLLSIQQTGAECIFSWSANTNDDGIILRQVKQLGLDVDFVGSTSYGSLDVTVKIAGDDAEGVYSIMDISSSDPSPVVQEIDQMLNERYNYRFGNTFMYDDMMILADAMKRAGIIQEIDGKKMIMPLEEAREAIRTALKDTKNFSEGTAKTYTCDEVNDLAHSMTIVQIENGAHKIITKIDLMEN